MPRLFQGSCDYRMRVESHSSVLEHIDANVEMLAVTWDAIGSGCVRVC